MTREEFLCPRCRTSLMNSDGTMVRMKGRLDCDRFSVSFPIELPAQLGVYGATMPEGIALRDGAEVQFSCPHCGADFTVPDAPHHAAILMHDSEGSTKVVVFNKLYGEHTSFVFDLDTRALIAAYGEHQGRWMDEVRKDINFFGF